MLHTATTFPLYTHHGILWGGNRCAFLSQWSTHAIYTVRGLYKSALTWINIYCNLVHSLQIISVNGFASVHIFAWGRISYLVNTSTKFTHTKSSWGRHRAVIKSKRKNKIVNQHKNNVMLQDYTSTPNCQTDTWKFKCITLI